MGGKIELAEMVITQEGYQTMKPMIPHSETRFLRVYPSTDGRPAYVVLDSQGFKTTLIRRHLQRVAQLYGYMLQIRPRFWGGWTVITRTARHPWPARDQTITIERGEL
jgi:hypothetical protein